MTRQSAGRIATLIDYAIAFGLLLVAVANQNNTIAFLGLLFLIMIYFIISNLIWKKIRYNFPCETPASIELKTVYDVIKYFKNINTLIITPSNILDDIVNGFDLRYHLEDHYSDNAIHTGTYCGYKLTFCTSDNEMAKADFNTVILYNCEKDAAARKSIDYSTATVIEFAFKE